MQLSSTIPKVFQRSEGGFLSTCIMCERSLLHPAHDYLIEKAFRCLSEYRRTEVIFEYAMCLVCAEAMRRELSTESKQRIEKYFKTRVDFEARQHLLHPKRAHLSKWIGACLVSLEPTRKASEYSLYARAFGNKLVYDLFPYAIAGKVMEEINGLLSEKTREVLDDFIGKHFSGPPEVAEILKRRPVLV